LVYDSLITTGCSSTSCKANYNSMGQYRPHASPTICWRCRASGQVAPSSCTMWDNSGHWWGRCRVTSL